jgi:general secretion pathway protein G
MTREPKNQRQPAPKRALVKGFQVGGQADHKVRLLRKIQIDPITGLAEWNYQAIPDDSDSTSRGGKNVFDVHSKSQATALDGSKYSEW